MLKRLKKGDKIGIYSPSSPATVWAYERFVRAKDFLEEKGFIIVEGKLTGQSEEYRSGTPKERAEELNELLRDPNIKMVMSTIGGTNSNSMLPYIDYEAFKEHPKLIVGIQMQLQFYYRSMLRRVLQHITDQHLFLRSASLSHL